MSDAWIIDTCRTPRGIGKKGKGSLTHMHPQHLAATVLRGLTERNNLNTADIDDVILGTSVQRGLQANNLARMAALDADLSPNVSGVTIDRYCGSGISSVAMGAASVKAGFEHLIIAGGCEMMSTHAENTLKSNFLDNENLRLRSKYPQSHQGVCADVIATLEGIGREPLDELALLSQQRTAYAIENGYFDKSLIPVHNTDGSLALAKDEHPRPETTLDILAGLKPAFTSVVDALLDDSGTTYGGVIRQSYPDLQIDHVHTAGSSSGVVDGAAAVLLASPDYARTHGLRPRARIIAAVNVGDDPVLKLNGPVPAALKVLAQAGLSVNDIDLFEINEAFAVVAEKFIRDLDLDRAKVNVNGGAMALGHPIGATGAVLIGTILDELERRDGQFGLVTMCAAGGMAPAIIVERI